MKLLTINNTKIMKGEAFGYLTAGLHLAPHTLSGFNVCQSANEECSSACLNRSGHGVYSTTQKARIKRTKMLFEDRATFMKLLERDIQELIRKAKRENLKPACRLNLTSDLPWHKIRVRDGQTIMELYPEVIWYNYTKRSRVLTEGRKGEYTTFSRSGDNDRECYEALYNGVNVAVVMSSAMLEDLPKFRGRLKLFNGDFTDLRFLDPKGKIGRIIYLKAKGPARKQTGKFVIQSLNDLQAFNTGFNAFLREKKNVDQIL